MVELQRQLSELRTLTDRERELVAIHRDTTEREREAITQINRQLLTQIKALKKAQERVIELSVREAQMDVSSQAHQRSPALTDLHFKLT